MPVLTTTFNLIIQPSLGSLIIELACSGQQKQHIVPVTTFTKQCNLHPGNLLQRCNGTLISHSSTLALESLWADTLIIIIIITAQLRPTTALFQSGLDVQRGTSTSSSKHYGIWAWHWTELFPVLLHSLRRHAVKTMTAFVRLWSHAWTDHSSIHSRQSHIHSLRRCGMERPAGSRRSCAVTRVFRQRLKIFLFSRSYPMYLSSIPVWT